MRAKPMILILIALGCGLVASIGISQVLERGKGRGPAVEMQEILVAMKAIDIGEKLDSKNLKLEKWPRDRLPPDSVSKLSQVEGQFPAQRLYPGEPILKAKLMDSQNGAVRLIPDGFSVVSVKVALETGVSGLLKPGDHVDVIVYFKRGAEVRQATTRTMLRKVRVFAVNEHTTRDSDAKEDKSIQAKTVSLLVRPPQVEMITLATEIGKIRLAMRRPGDAEEEATEGVTTAELLALGGQAATESPPAEETKPKADFLSFLQGAMTSAKQNTPSAPAYSWAMDVFTPEGPTRFMFKDDHSLPYVYDGTTGQQVVDTHGIDQTPAAPANTPPPNSNLNSPSRPK